MKLTKFFLLAALVSVSISCAKWQLPEKCTETLPTDINISTTGNTVTASAGTSSAAWSLVNAKGEAVKTASGTSFPFTSTEYPTDSYTIKASGKNTCGFSFSLQKAYSICTDVAPTDITITTTNNTVTSSIGGLTADWSLVNASGIVVNTFSGTSYSVLTTTYFNGSYTIKATGKTACNTSFNLTKPYTINTGTPLIETVSIPGGTYEMGDTRNEGELNEKPSHMVTISSFKMGRYEITQKQYKTVIGTNPSFFTNCDDCPVEQVSWLDAVAFCNALSDLEAKQKVYTINGSTVTINQSVNGYRLPNEAEWEYAAGGGSSNRTRFGNGKDIANPEEINFDGSLDGKQTYSVIGVKRGNTLPAASLISNVLGLFNMTGNVGEWCADWFDENINIYSNGTQTNPTGLATGTHRLTRGGSFYNYPKISRVASRDRNVPSTRSQYIGFRVVSGN